MKRLIHKIQIALTNLFLIFGVIGCTNRKSIVFANTEAKVNVPFYYSRNGHMISQVIIQHDTLLFMVDTGMGKSIISSHVKSEDTGQRAEVSDILGFRKKLKKVILKKINWGDVQISGFSFGEYNIPEKKITGIIGADILRHFYVKIDNAGQNIELTLKPAVLEMEGMKVPFIFNKNAIQISASVAEYKTDFLIDTGCNLDLLLDSASYNSMQPNNTESMWPQTANSLFSKANIKNQDTAYFSISDFSLGNKVFSYASTTYMRKITRNLIGTIFLRRFQSVAIDYENKNLYFKLPPDVSIMKFSDHNIKAVPFSFLEVLYMRINSLGLEFKDNPRSFVLDAMEVGDQIDPLQIGDTLVGINEFLFEQNLLNKLNGNGNNFILMDSFGDQQKLVSDIFHKRAKAEFHFLKNGQLFSVDKIRKYKLTPSPVAGYGFSDKYKNNGFYAVSFDSLKSQKMSSFSICIPWSTLSGQEIELSYYKDGNKQKLSNKPDNRVDNIN